LGEFDAGFVGRPLGAAQGVEGGALGRRARIGRRLSLQI